MDKYLDIVNDILKRANATIDIEYGGKTFNRNWNDTEKRNFYNVTITTPKGRMFTVFWASLKNTKLSNITYDDWIAKNNVDTSTSSLYAKAIKEYKAVRDNAKPNAYDIIACITKEDPGYFADFCDNFDLSTDSRTALNLYLTACDEYKQLTKIFTPEQIEELREIN